MRKRIFHIMYPIISGNVHNPSIDTAKLVFSQEFMGKVELSYSLVLTIRDVGDQKSWISHSCRVPFKNVSFRPREVHCQVCQQEGIYLAGDIKKHDKCSPL